MAVFGEIANAIDPDIEVEIDFPSKHPSKMLAILDMEMGMIDNKVHYMFYRKPMANKYTMMANSAVSDRVKRSTMTNETLRRLLCCSPNLEEQKKVQVMEDYAKLLKTLKLRGRDILRGSGMKLFLMPSEVTRSYSKRRKKGEDH